MFGYFPYLFVEALDVVFVALAFVFRKLFLNNLAEGVVFLDFVLGDFRFSVIFSGRLLCGFCRCGGGIIEFYMV